MVAGAKARAADKIGLGLDKISALDPAEDMVLEPDEIIAVECGGQGGSVASQVVQLVRGAS